MTAMNVAFIGALERPIVATGGTITNITGATVHNFASNGTLSVTDGHRAKVDFAVLAGGGGGATGDNSGCSNGPGGAGGQFITSFGTVQSGQTLQNPKFFTPNSFSVTRGNGGGAAGENQCGTGRVGGASLLDGVSASGGHGGRQGGFSGASVSNNITGNAITYSGGGGQTNVPDSNTRNGPANSGRGGTGAGWWYTAGSGGTGRVVVRYARYS